MRPVAAFLIASSLGIVAPPGVAQARKIATVGLRDIPTVPVVMVATVVSSTPTKEVVEQRQPVRHLEVTLKPVLRIKGVAKTVTSLKLHHFQSLPPAEPVLNGFSFPALKPGSSYLIFAEAHPAGGYRLTAREAALVELTAQQVRALVKTSKYYRSVKPKVAVTRILRRHITSCQGDCNRALWMLNVPTVRDWVGAERASFIADLMRLRNEPLPYNTRLAAYGMLGRLKVNKVVKDLVAIALDREDPGTADPVGWLQTFEVKVQRRALNRIIKWSRHPALVKKAKSRLLYVR